MSMTDELDVLDGAHQVAAPVDGSARADVSTGGDRPVTMTSRYFTSEQLDQLEADTTVGDAWRANQEAPEDRGRQGMLIFWYAARRTGLIDHELELESFLDRVRLEDFKRVARAGSGKLSDAS